MLSCCRSKVLQNTNQHLIKIEGVNTAKDAEFYLGKRVFFVYKVCFLQLLLYCRLKMKSTELTTVAFKVRLLLFMVLTVLYVVFLMLLWFRSVWSSVVTFLLLLLARLFVLCSILAVCNCWIAGCWSRLDLFVKQRGYFRFVLVDHNCKHHVTYWFV